VNLMPVVIKAKKNDSNGSMMRRFKKAVMAEDIVQKTRDRRFYKKPATIRAEKKAEKHHLRKRLKTLKRMKNISDHVLDILRDKINNI